MYLSLISWKLFLRVQLETAVFIYIYIAADFQINKLCKNKKPFTAVFRSNSQFHIHNNIRKVVWKFTERPLNIFPSQNRRNSNSSKDLTTMDKSERMVLTKIYIHVLLYILCFTLRFSYIEWSKQPLLCLCTQCTNDKYTCSN